MQSTDLQRSLPSLFAELAFGPPGSSAFVLNPGDQGLLSSLDRLTAEQASAPAGRSSIAAHVRHLDYGLSLMNRWAAGEANPFEEADWSAAWRQTRVTADEWADLRAALAASCRTWHRHLQSPRPVEGVELDGVIGSVAHLAYHLGALRQMDASLRGPAEGSGGRG